MTALGATCSKSHCDLLLSKMAPPQNAPRGSLTAAHARLRGGGSPPFLPRAAYPLLSSSLLTRLQGGAGMPTGRSLPSLFTRHSTCPLLCSSLPATYLSLQGISCKRFNPLLQCLEQCSAQPTHTHQRVPTLTSSKRHFMNYTCIIIYIYTCISNCY